MFRRAQLNPIGPAGLLLLVLTTCTCGGNRREEPTSPGVDIGEEERQLLQTLVLRDDSVPPDATNAYADDERAAAFGQRLFHYPGFAGPLLESDNDGGPESLGVRGETGKVACSGCHIPSAGFVDTRSRGQQISLAAGWTERRTPSLLDVGHKKLLTWVGKVDTFYAQVFTVIENHREMNSSRLFVAQEVHRSFRDEYEAIFGPLPPLGDEKRFPPLSPEMAGCDAPAPMQAPVCRGRPGDGDVYDALHPDDQAAVTQVVVNLGKALGAYQRKLHCGPSRFDEWMRGDEDALTDAEKRGALVFAGPGKCIDCHSGPHFTDFDFHNVGLQPTVVAVAFVEGESPGAAEGLAQALSDPLNSRGIYSDGDDARLPDDVDDSKLGAFATPSLRCVSMRPSLMHTGQIDSLESAIAFFNRGGSESGFAGKSEIKQLGLSDQERADLAAFLRALDGPGPTKDLLGPPPDPSP